MKSVDLVRMMLDMSAQFTLNLIDDMKDAPLTFPTPRGGNHPLWVLGHLAWTEGEVIQHYMLGNPNPVGHWREVFADGSEPVADASKYPPYDELLKTFQSLRAKTLDVLASMSDGDLDKPSRNPRPGYEQILGTNGGCLMIIVFNTLTHRGQVADARRALGRSRLAT